MVLFPEVARVEDRLANKVARLRVEELEALGNQAGNKFEVHLRHVDLAVTEHGNTGLRLWNLENRDRSDLGYPTPVRAESVCRAAVTRDAKSLAERAGASCVGLRPVQTHDGDCPHELRATGCAQDAELRQRQSVEQWAHQSDFKGVGIDRFGLEEHGGKVTGVRVSGLRVRRRVSGVQPLNDVLCDQVTKRCVEVLRADWCVPRNT